jgi:hypothetical protein
VTATASAMFAVDSARRWLSDRHACGSCESSRRHIAELATLGCAQAAAAAQRLLDQHIATDHTERTDDQKWNL